MSCCFILFACDLLFSCIYYLLALLKSTKFGWKFFDTIFYGAKYMEYLRELLGWWCCVVREFCFLEFRLVCMFVQKVVVVVFRRSREWGFWLFLSKKAWSGWWGMGLSVSSLLRANYCFLLFLSESLNGSRSLLIPRTPLRMTILGPDWRRSSWISSPDVSVGMMFICFSGVGFRLLWEVCVLRFIILGSIWVKKVLLNSWFL